MGMPTLKAHAKRTMVSMRTEKDFDVETRYEVLYEDDSFLVADKPAPLPVHRGGRFIEKNLLALLKKERYGDLRIVNRLDSETSGLVIVAKGAVAAGKLGMLFEKREVYKEYRAVVLGIPQPAEGSITVPLGPKKLGFCRMRAPDPAGEAARTDYAVLKDFGAYALLKVIPQTGRMHQIRAHLACLGHPVAGDKLYIDPAVFERYLHEGWQEDMESVVKSRRLLLHAARLIFRHPATGERMEFVCELPPCFESFTGDGDL